MRWVRDTPGELLSSCMVILVLPIQAMLDSARRKIDQKPGSFLPITSIFSISNTSNMPPGLEPERAEFHQHQAEFGGNLNPKTHGL